MAGRLPYEKTIGGTIYVRLVVPPALQPFAKKQKNVYRAIGASRQEAKRNHARALASAQDEMDGYRRLKAEADGVELQRTARRYVTKLPDQIARDHYAEELALDMGSRLTPDRELAITPPLTGKYRIPILRRLAAGNASNEEMAANVGWAIDEYRRRGNHENEFGSPAWRALAMKLALVELEIAERAAERDQGDYNGRAKMPALLADEPDPRPAVPIMGLFDAYFTELARSGKGAAAKRRWKPAFKHIINFVGHDDAGRLTRADVLKWKDDLLTRLAPKTVRDSNLAALKAVLQWAKDNDRIADNPAADIRLKVAAKP